LEKTKAKLVKRNPTDEEVVGKIPVHYYNNAGKAVKTMYYSPCKEDPKKIGRYCKTLWRGGFEATDHAEWADDLTAGEE
jgi:hypothetical protein